MILPKAQGDPNVKTVLNSVDRGPFHLNATIRPGLSSVTICLRNDTILFVSPKLGENVVPEPADEA